MQARCWSRHCLQASAAAASATEEAPLVPSSTAITRTTRIAISSSLLSASRARRFIEGGAQTLGQLQRVVVCPKVHEDQARLLGQHMAVDRRHLDIVCPQ